MARTAKKAVWNTRKAWFCCGDGAGVGSHWTIKAFDSKADAEMEMGLARTLGGPKAMCLGMGTEIEIRHEMDKRGRIVDNAIYT